MTLPPSFKPGDVALVDWLSSKFDGNGTTTGISRAGIIVKLSNGTLGIAQHGGSKDDHFDTFKDWSLGGKDPHIWIVSPGEK